MNAVTANGYRVGHYPDDFDMTLRFWPDVCFMFSMGLLLGWAIAALWLWRPR